MKVELVHCVFDPAACLADFIALLDGQGAVVSFTGHARDKCNDGTPIEALVLESYRGVTLASMQAIVADAHVRFDISESCVIHRAGTILPGECIVFVAVASAHRRAAFAAAEYTMDRLKAEAVFWKREESGGESRWIEPTDADLADLARWSVGHGA